MAGTLADLRTAIEAFAATEDTDRFPDTAKDLCLNLGMRRLCRRFATRHNFKEDTFDTVATQGTYSVPSDLSRVYRLWYYTTEGEQATITFLSTPELLDAEVAPNADDGDPTHYTIKGASIVLRPAPARIITVYREYYALFADLVAGVDHNTLTDAAWEQVLFVALADFAPLYLMEDARIPYWQAKRDELIKDYTAEQSMIQVKARRPVTEMPRRR